MTYYVSCYVSEIVYVLVGVFFFQAEDGIRDLVRSRGLGDVYKRQDQGAGDDQQTGKIDKTGFNKTQYFTQNINHYNQAVSYTHLTLPTSDLV